MPARSSARRPGRSARWSLDTSICPDFSCVPSGVPGGRQFLGNCPMGSQVAIAKFQRTARAGNSAPAGSQGLSGPGKHASSHANWLAVPKELLCNPWPRQPFQPLAHFPGGTSELTQASPRPCQASRPPRPPQASPRLPRTAPCPPLAPIHDAKNRPSRDPEEVRRPILEARELKN